MTRLYSDNHYSKRPVFRGICSGCGAQIKRNNKSKLVGYLCRQCGPHIKESDVTKQACYQCQFELDCTARVQFGIWVRCESPDIADIERLKFSGGLENEEVRRELENALGKRGDREVLEKAVSQGAQKVYQSYSSRGQGEMPIGIRERREL